MLDVHAVLHLRPVLPAGALAPDPPHQPHIERTFSEPRRRVKVIGRLPGERSALSLLFAVLDRAAGGWRGVTYIPADVRLLQMICRDLGLTTARKEHPDPDPHGDGTDVA
jgi:putative transposase